MSTPIDDGFHGTQRSRNAGDYEYSPIQPNEIRILVVEPGTDESPLRGHFETALMESRPLYSALSYAWGDLILSEAITLGEEKQKITSSLQRALRRFRSTESPVRLWADAVCINQRDTEERNSQVAMMADIYAYAETVLIWLGESSHRDIPMLWLCNYWSEMTSDLENYDQEFYLVSAQDARSSLTILDDAEFTMRCACCTGVMFASQQPQSSNFDALVDSILAICDRVYFRRLWPLQEMAVAKSAWIYVGQHTVRLAILVKAIYQLEALFLEDTQFSRMMRRHTPCRDALLRCRHALDWTKYGQSDEKLLAVLCGTSRQEVSEPRDRVYAVRQLAELARTDILIPDYSISTSTLWKRVAHHIIMTPSSYDTPLLLALSSK